MSRSRLTCRLEITEELPAHLGYIPMAPEVDFVGLIAAAGVPGQLDPASIEVVDLSDGARVPCALTEDIVRHGHGRLEWTIRHPGHRQYQIGFAADTAPPTPGPPRSVPPVGVGDLLRYGGQAPRPLTLYSMRLVDLRGCGRADLAGTWNYYHRPGTPLSGVVCHCRVDGDSRDFGDLTHLQFRDRDDGPLQDFPGTYVDVDFGDVDGDGRIDLVFAERGSRQVTFFLNTGERNLIGLPVFRRGPVLAIPGFDLGSLSLVDLDGDGVLDLVIEGNWLRNRNPAGWPFDAAEPVDLGSGPRLAFIDLTGDGQLDLVGLAEPDAVTHHPTESVGYVGYVPFWRPRLVPGAVTFGEPRPLPGLPPMCNRLAATDDGLGLLVQDEALQRWRYFAAERLAGEPRMAPRWRAEGVGAVMALGDQAWPCLCDWNGDGGPDLLVGGGYGWPRILEQTGAADRPVWAEAQLILARRRPDAPDQEAIRLLREQLLGGRHWHNMGYPYPTLVDWDGDGRPDLMLPNETNRIVWCRNEGTREVPCWGPLRFLAVDDYPDSSEVRAASARLGADPSLPNHPYPADPSSPFAWRTGAAFADWNGDGLMDFITHSWRRQATLFVQYRDAHGELRVRDSGPVRLIDGRCIDDSIVGRPMHWTESFRAVDWDGDGLTDLVYSLAGTGAAYLLRNVGSVRQPVFDLPRRFCCYGEPLAFTIHGPSIWAGDVNGDGKPDLLGCVEWSVYPFFAHAALEMPAHPRYRLTLQTAMDE